MKTERNQTVVIKSNNNKIGLTSSITEEWMEPESWDKDGQY